MQRVSSMMTHNDLQYGLRAQESRLERANNQINSQHKIQSLRDDPIAAGHSVRYQSYLTRMDTFEENAHALTDQYAFAEGYMESSLDIMKRLKELAVAAAHGTFNPEDTKLMAVEADELLRELIQNANATGEDGLNIFAGTRTRGTAFEIEQGSVPGAPAPMITNVRYNGNISVNKIEVDEGQYLELDRAGNRTFWAEQQRLSTDRDMSAYQVQQDSAVNVDGVEIALTAGDNIYSVIAKINDSGAAAKASLDPVTRGLVIETTDARQLWLEDVQGTTLFDLGVIADASQKPPYNVGPAARISGGSLFDSVISLRDAMIAGDQERIGTRIMGSLDAAISNLAHRTAESGSKYERAVMNANRNAVTKLNVTGMLARENDIDMSQAIIDLKTADFVHQATLSTAAKLYETSLLNYLR
ncbi:MAG: flagellar hook-associated protein 3 [Treponemataceae bacterium]|nr:MAG: flagellar hook-associated protein 3 [Treponemataceae bacterium]